MKANKVITIDDESYALSDEFMSRVLETAVEGACSYWADIQAENRGDSAGADGARDYEASDYYADENGDEDEEDEEDEDPDDAPFYTAVTFLVSKDPNQGGTLDLQDIADAIERIANQEVEIAPAIREIIVAAIEEEDASEIDAEAADCIVQIGLFDEIIFS